MRPLLRVSSSLSPSFKHLLAPSMGLGYPAVICRTYAYRKQGATSRPVKVKEHEPHKSTSNANLAATATPQQEAPVAPQFEQAQVPDYQSIHGGRTASQVIDSNVSLQAFLKRSMTTTAAAVGITAASTAVFMTAFPSFIMAHPYICAGVGIVASIGSLVGMNMVRPTFVQEGQIVKAVDSDARKALFGTFLVGQGLAMAPMMYIAASMAPMAIPIAGALALGTMAGMGAYALRQPQGSLMKWGPALSVGLFGLIGVGIVNIFVGSSALSFATSAIGIGIFSAFTAYDTHVAIQDHHEGRPDHLLTAANFYLNFVNLFLDYLRIIRGFFEE